jgi:hypothetical protein
LASTVAINSLVMREDPVRVRLFLIVGHSLAGSVDLGVVEGDTCVDFRNKLPVPIQVVATSELFTMMLMLELGQAPARQDGGFIAYRMHEVSKSLWGRGFFEVLACHSSNNR